LWKYRNIKKLVELFQESSKKSILHMKCYPFMLRSGKQENNNHSKAVCKYSDEPSGSVTNRGFADQLNEYEWL